MHTTIWFNALALRPGGSGVQTYIRELLANLPDTIDATMMAALQQDALGEIPERIEADVRPVCAGARRALEGLRPAPPCDLIHGLDVDLPMGTRGAATVATVHDCAVVDVPWAFPATRARAERLLLRRTAQLADCIVTPSTFTAERVAALYGRQATVTPLAAGPWAAAPAPEQIHEIRQKYALPEDFALQVGTVEPRKLTRLLIAAGRESGVPVVLVGTGSKELSGQGVTGLGHVPAADLPALYAAAAVVCYLSAYEGFGLPPLEAMACGAAVLASRIAPVEEVLGDAALLVPNRLSTLTRELKALVSEKDHADELRQAGVMRASTYSWANTAIATRTVYERLLT